MKSERQKHGQINTQRKMSRLQKGKGHCFDWEMNSTRVALFD